MPICKYCEKDFNRARDTRLFCSDRCRVYWNRHNSVTDKKISVTKEPVSVTEEDIEEIIYDDSESNTRAEDWNSEKDI